MQRVVLRPGPTMHAERERMAHAQVAAHSHRDAAPR